MRLYADTSIVLPIVNRRHVTATRVAELKRRVGRGDDVLVTSTHTIAEAFHHLTGRPEVRWSPAAAIAALQELRDQPNVEVVPLDRADYDAAMHRVRRVGWTGGAIYDALHIEAADRSDVAKLATFNTRDFVGLWPERAGDVWAPE